MRHVLWSSISTYLRIRIALVTVVQRYNGVHVTEDTTCSCGVPFSQTEVARAEMFGLKLPWQRDSPRNILNILRYPMARELDETIT